MSSGGHGGGGLPFLGAITNFLHYLHNEYGLHLPGWIFWVPFALINAFFLVLFPVQTIYNWSIVIFLSPVWLPALLGIVASRRWLEVRRLEFLSTQDSVLLEIRIPRDTRKSPVAMETVFTNLHLGPGEGNWWKKYILGRVRPWYSFELISIEGQVHFCVWTRPSLRRAVETYIYAQYPGVEVVEMPDYLRLVDAFAPGTRVWGCEFKLRNPDANSILTYRDLDLDKPEKPEETVDPLSQVIEFLGSLGTGEYLWIQIMARTTKWEKYGSKKNKSGKQYTWKDEAQEIIQKVRDDSTPNNTYVDAAGKTVKSKGFPNMTKGQSEYIAELENTTGKPAYDVGMRAVYIGKQGRYVDNIGVFVTSIWKPFAGSNEFVTQPNWSEKYKDFPWEDTNKHHYNHDMHELIKVARRRAYFYPPYPATPMLMNAEALATIFHIPSATVSTPGLPRIGSSTREAPPNLPT